MAIKNSMYKKLMIWTACLIKFKWSNDRQNFVNDRMYYRYITNEYYGLHLRIVIEQINFENVCINIFGFWTFFVEDLKLHNC